MIDLKKMTEELVERYLSGRDVPFKNPDIYRALQSAHGSWLPRFAYDLARQVAEAVIAEGIKRVPYGADSDMSDFCLGRRVGFGNAEAALKELKREICGESKKEDGNG